MNFITVLIALMCMVSCTSTKSCRKRDKVVSAPTPPIPAPRTIQERYPEVPVWEVPNEELEEETAEDKKKRWLWK